MTSEEHSKNVSSLKGDTDNESSLDQYSVEVLEAALQILRAQRDLKQ